MKLHYGDLIEEAKNGRFDVIIHGCNCFHTMGAGIAKSISKQYPSAYFADKKTPYGEKSKLGTFSEVSVEGNDGNKFIIINAYTQHGYGRGRDNFSYDTFPKLLSDIKEKYGHLKIGLPLIGCGLAGGDEPKILKMIREGFDGVDYKLMDIDRNRRLKLEDVKFDPSSITSPMHTQYPSPFKYKNIQFFSVQQFSNYAKAKLIGDEHSANKIMMANDNEVIKKLISGEYTKSSVMDTPSRNKEYVSVVTEMEKNTPILKGSELEEWNRREVNILTVANREKFSQNPELGEYLEKSSKVGLFNHSPNHESLANVKNTRKLKPN